MGASPFVAGENVILGSDQTIGSFIIALDRLTGKPALRHDRGDYLVGGRFVIRDEIDTGEAAGMPGIKCDENSPGNYQDHKHLGDAEGDFQVGVYYSDDSGLDGIKLLSAKLLAGGESLRFKQDDQRISIILPDTVTIRGDLVIELTMNRSLENSI